MGLPVTGKQYLRKQSRIKPGTVGNTHLSLLQFHEQGSYLLSAKGAHSIRV